MYISYNIPASIVMWQQAQSQYRDLFKTQMFNFKTTKISKKMFCSFPDFEASASTLAKIVEQL